MTVVDFRSGGFDGSHRGAGSYADHDYAPGQAHGHADADWTDDQDWDEGRFATDQGAAGLTGRDTLVGRVARLTHYLGALVSVLLVLFLVVWGYQLVVRDVSGVPVIRAVQGESRTAPDEPGGQLSERSGLAVNQIAAGAEPRPVSEVAIAPGPTGLTADDVAMGKLGATARATALTEEIPADPNARDVIAMSDAEAARRAAEQAAADAAAAEASDLAAVEMATDESVLSNAPAAEDAVNEAVTDLDGAQSQDTAITQALTEAGVQPAPGALASSPRPAPRPRRAASAATAAPAAVAAPAEAPAAAPAEPAAPAPTPGAASAKVESGAALVQIGAFDSDAIASSEWDRISGRYSSLFAGKAPVVQKHEAGGRTFWRLRVAGFEDRDAARKFCAALIEAGGDCIPAVAK